MTIIKQPSWTKTFTSTAPLIRQLYDFMAAIKRHNNF